MARRLFLALAVVAALVALAAGAAFVPAVQRAVALRVLAPRPGCKLAIGRLAVRPGSVELRDLDYGWPGGRLTLAHASASLSLWDLVMRRQANLDDARVSGLKITLTGRTAAEVGAPPESAAPETSGSGGETAAPPAAPSPAALAAISDLFPHLRVPLHLRLAHGQVEAQIEYPRGRGKPAGEARLSVTGGGLAPGREARFEIAATLHNPDPAAPVDTVEARGHLTAVLDADGTFQQLGAHLDAEARGSRLLLPARLQSEAAAVRTAAGERYTLSLRLPDSGPTDKLVGVDLASVAGSSQMTGTWQVRVNDGQIAPFTMGVALPQFSVTGAGRFDFNPATLATRLEGRLSGEFSRLQVIDARLRELNGLSATATFDGDGDAAHLRVTGLAVNVEGRRPVLAIQTIQPFSLDFASHRLSAADPAKELLEATVQELPVAWLEPWLAPGVTVDGGDGSGELAAELHGDHLRVRTVTPLRIRGLALARRGRVLLPACDLDAQTELEYAKDERRVRVEQLSLTTAAGDRLTAHGDLRLQRNGTPDAQVTADFEGSLPALLAAYAPGVPLVARGEFGATRRGGVVQVDRLALAARSPAGETLADLNLTQPLRYDRATGRLGTVSGQAGELARLRMGPLPLSAFQPYVDGVALAGRLAGGELTVTSADGKVHASSTVPWRVEGLTLASGTDAWLKDLGVEIDAAADYSPEQVTARIHALRARTAANATLFTGQGKAALDWSGDRAVLSGTGSFDLMVPVLAAQPVLAGRIRPGSGKLSGEVTFTRTADLLGEGRLTLNGLTSPDDGTPLPVVNLSFRAGCSEAGDVALRVPVLVDRAGERSDFTVAATLHPIPGGHSLDARISSDHLVIDDLATLVRSLAVPAAAAAPAAWPALVDAGAAAAEAPWGRLSGQVTLGLKSVSYGPTTAVTGVTGRLVIDPSRIVAEQIAGQVGAGGQALLNARVDFSAADADPFTSMYDLTIQGFDLSPYFKAAAPGKPLPVEGLFDVRSRGFAAGRTVAALWAHARGDLTFQSRKGVFRALARPPPPPPRSGIVSGAARVLSDIGEKVGNLVSSSDAADALAAQLAAIPYDQLNVRVSRDAAGDLKLADFSLVSPVVRLQGDGQVTHDPAKGVLDQPLQLRVNMGVMGAVESALAHAKSSLLAGDHDDLGYLKLREPVVIGGTLDRPDAGPFYGQVGRSLLDILRR